MKKMLEKANSKWTRLIILVVVFINTAGMVLGHQLLPFENEEIAGGISIVALIISEVWNHWKNNSYTDAAKEGDRIMSINKRRRERVK